MSDRVAFIDGRAFPRLALTGLALLWLSGCSSEVSRFDMSSNPFSNPFSSQTASATSTKAAPSGQLAAAPSAPTQSVASAALPSVSAAPAAVGGSAAGWSARGGTPIVVAQNDTLDTLSRRFGVPASALLRANGLSSPAEVKGGMHIVVPVYNAGGAHAVADAAPSKPSAKKRSEVASNDGAERSKTRKVKDKADEKTADKSDEKTAHGSSDKKKDKLAEKTKDKPAKTVVAKAEPANPTGKKVAVDDTPTGNVNPKAASAKQPTTSAEADASGSTPEFRWPARGRIIEGFKSGGNDGINISVPPGTSVRAAESGVVVYSGDGLKGYGNLVLIKHPNGFVSAYANNGELDVKRGQQVKRGQIIAKSGDTGNVNAPQLHFELRKGSTPVDPTQYLAGL
ncbi:MAG TPA: M23 family metallopeptidase [Roseiarcus sp.]|nr:M23 family metallopeptidase [Roseiarcus sp.]